MKIFNKLKIILSSIFVFSMNVITVYADANDELKKLLIGDQGLLTILQYAGSVIIVLGLGKLILAFHSDDANGKAQATTILLAGVFLATIKTIINLVAPSAGLGG